MSSADGEVPTHMSRPCGFEDFLALYAQLGIVFQSEALQDQCNHKVEHDHIGKEPASRKQESSRLQQRPVNQMPRQ